MSIECLKINSKNVIKETINLNDIKSEIFDYNIRDLYFFDSKTRFDISSITKKNNCIICKLDIFECIIFIDKAYLILKNKNYLTNYNDILNFLKNNISTPFHINIIEYLFINVLNVIDNEFINLFNEEDKNSLHIYISLYTKLINLEYRVKELLDITEDLIDKNNFKNDILFQDHENNYTEDYIKSIETLIDNYHLKLGDIYHDISKIIKQIDNNQKIANIKLAQERNKYAIYQLYISFLSLSICLGTYITGIFGMNLKSNIENSNVFFYIIIIISVLIIFFTFLFQIYFFKI